MLRLTIIASRTYPSARWASRIAFNCFPVSVKCLPCVPLFNSLFNFLASVVAFFSSLVNSSKGSTSLGILFLSPMFSTSLSSLAVSFTAFSSSSVNSIIGSTRRGILFLSPSSETSLSNLAAALPAFSSSLDNCFMEFTLCWISLKLLTRSLKVPRLLTPTLLIRSFLS